jgi:hypothetical protein
VQWDNKKAEIIINGRTAHYISAVFNSERKPLRLSVGMEMTKLPAANAVAIKELAEGASQDLYQMAGYVYVRTITAVPRDLWVKLRPDVTAVDQVFVSEPISNILRTAQRKIVRSRSG